MTARQVFLGDVADLLVGFAFKSAQFLQPSDTGINLVRGDNVQQGFLRWGDRAMKWSSDAYEDFARYHLQLNDVLLAMDRPIVGGGLKLAWVKETDLPCLLVQRVTRIRGLSCVADTNYLRFVLSAPDFAAHIDRITTGANIPHISGKDISAFSFRLPPLDEQLTIVEKLLAYDDLIENNRCRIALLEKSARLLYREWFVHRRFPGYEFHTVVDALPEGWAITSLSSLGVVNKDSLGTRDLPDKVRYIDISAVQTGVATIPEAIDYSDAPGRARRLVQHGDVIWSCVRPNRRSYALMWQPDPLIVVSTGFAVLSAVEVPFTYLYLATTEDDFVAHLTNRATGAAYPAVSNTDFQDAPLVRPDDMTLAAFHERCLPMLEMKHQLLAQNERLAEVRDALLPKLMSGEIAV
jgi:type I restriction enzyme S subunit